ncbi:MAG: response regulator, partial [Alphaproteobacteria bacterium]|nr:response regulator [Alphaproteobacteria bacterium]
MQGQSSRTKDHILVVDDDVRISELVSRYLHEQDFIALTASCAEDARKKLEVFEFDALIIDVMMPGQNGLEFTQSLREEGIVMPVLLLTALSEAEDRIAGLETGADDYLAKPFEPRELVLRLKSILKRSQRSLAEVSSLYKMGACIYDKDN